jgi:hypothetical protein
MIWTNLAAIDVTGWFENLKSMVSMEVTGCYGNSLVAMESHWLL